MQILVSKIVLLITGLVLSLLAYLVFFRRIYIRTKFATETTTGVVFKYRNLGDGMTTPLYRYIVDGKEYKITYSSQTVTEKWVGPTGIRFHTETGRFITTPNNSIKLKHEEPLGTENTVFYNPKHPKQARLEGDNFGICKIAGTIIVFIGIVLILLGIIIR